MALAVSSCVYSTSKNGGLKTLPRLYNFPVMLPYGPGTTTIADDSRRRFISPSGCAFALKALSRTYSTIRISPRLPRM